MCWQSTLCFSKEGFNIQNPHRPRCEFGNSKGTALFLAQATIACMVLFIYTYNRIYIYIIYCNAYVYHIYIQQTFITRILIYIMLHMINVNMQTSIQFCSTESKAPPPGTRRVCGISPCSPLGCKDALSSM